MRRIDSRLRNLQIGTTRVNGGIAGTLERFHDRARIWICPDTHRTERAAVECIRRELKRWVA